MIISYELLITGGTGKARRDSGAPDGAVAAVVVVATATATATPIVDDAEPAAHTLVLVSSGESLTTGSVQPVRSSQRVLLGRRASLL